MQIWNFELELNLTFDPILTNGQEW